MPDVWVNLAHVYFAQGNFALAVKMVCHLISLVFPWLISTFCLSILFINYVVGSIKTACGSSFTTQTLKFFFT